MTESGITSAGAVYRRLLSYVKPYTTGFIIAGMAMMLFAATEAAFAWLMKPLLDEGFIERDQGFINILPALIIGLFLVRGIVSFVSSYGINWVGRCVVRDLRHELFEHLVNMPTSRFDKASSGNLLSIITYNTEQISQAASNAVTVLIKDSVTFVLLLGVLFYRSWTLTLIFLIIAPVVAYTIFSISKRFRRISRKIQESMGSVTHVAEEAIDGHKVIKTFEGQEYETGSFYKAIERNRKQILKMEAAKSLGISFVELVASFGIAGVIYLATSSAMEGVITAGSFVSYMTALLLLHKPIKRLMTVNAYIQRGITAAQSVFSLLDQGREQDTGNREVGRATGAIEYRNVCFHYDADRPDVLQDVNFTIEPGMTVAFVGKSGSGKSTLVNLLPRFYELTGGTILLDNVDIRELGLKSLRRQIALVSQHVTLFNDTVRNNIAYGALSGASDTELQHVMEHSHALEFIQRLPQGLDTIIGEDGVMLSGGQRQRLAIARALLKNAPILILDEATSALDTESERYIQSALTELMENRTTLVIAHRLSTIENADRIFVMHNGAIVESGTHQTLLAEGGYYQRLQQMQYAD